MKEKLLDISSYFKEIEVEQLKSPLNTDVIVKKTGKASYQVLRGYLGDLEIRSDELSALENDQSRHLIWKWAGEHYFVNFLTTEAKEKLGLQQDSLAIGLRKVSVTNLFSEASKDYLIYIATKVGQLFYSNSDQVNDVSLIE